MNSEKAYAPDYEDFRSGFRLKLVVKREAKNHEVWVVDGNLQRAERRKIKTRALATLTPDGKRIHFAVPEGDGKWDFDLDASDVMTVLKMHHGETFSLTNVN